MPVAMTVATSDSGAGAGVQADLLTFAAHGVYGVTAFAALTAQNPRAVNAIAEQTPDFLLAQLDTLIDYYAVGAAKTGMLFSEPLIEATASFFRKQKIPLVVDPVMVSTSGACLLQFDAIAALRDQLFPCATLITPNLDELTQLTGLSVGSNAEIEDAARKLALDTGVAVLAKGGHAEGDELTDLLLDKNGERIAALTSRRRHRINTHGSGCTLSAAIAAGLAKGHRLPEAVTHAHHYLQDAMAHPIRVGEEPFIRHWA